MKKVLSLIFLPAFWLTLIGYILVVLSIHINPQSFPFIALSGLVFPFLFVLLFFITLVQLLLKNLVSFAIGIIVLAVTISTWSPLWGRGFKNTPTEYELKIMNYNVRNFDLYNWSNNQVARQTMMDIVKNENPDIICFQEFFSDEGKKLDNIQYIKNELGYNYYYFTRELVKSDTRQWGIATFSKYPILSKKNILKQEYPSAYGNHPYKGIITEILHNEDTFNIVNVHLQSVFLDDKDYETLKKITDGEKVGVEENMSIIRKFLVAYKRRAAQIENLFLELATLNKNTIICGDFNDTPASYTYNKITNEYKDVFPSSGKGWGATYNRFFPGFRIDYIMISKNLIPLKTYTIKDNTSDHNPLVSYIKKN